MRQIAYPTDVSGCDRTHEMNAKSAKVAKPSAIDRATHGTPRLAIVATITESALAGESGDVVERGFDGRHVGPGLQLPHPWRVDQQRAARQLDELSRRCRVAKAERHVGSPS